jgi:predicted RNA-binding protein with TRAM domain
MEISEQLACLFSAQIEDRDGSYVIEIPDQERRLGDLDEGTTYRVAVLPASTTSKEQPEREPEREPERKQGPLKPPVEEGETREVEIEDLGEQGDGIARVERGFVVIIPDTDKGERIRVEITDVRENVAFANVVERLSYYD